MFVLCPHCQFLVTLDPASGQPPARCPRCGGLLQSTAAAPNAPDAAPAATPAIIATPDASTSDVITASSPGADASHDDAEAIAGVNPEVETQVESPAAADDSATAMAQPPAAPTADAGTPQRKPRATPSFARRPVATAVQGPRRRWLRWLAVVALTLLLLLQLLLADRATLARDARWRPVLLSACSVVRCALPPWREPAAFTLLDRDVRARADMPGVLRVTATFRNDARWPQSWPMLQLTLSDLDGRAAATRVFAPSEYLGAPPAQHALASGQSATLAMDVVEPAPRIVAFTFELR